MKGTRNIYNTEPLLNEIENVVKNGLDKILSKTLQRYELLERTHKQLMNLPSIKEEIGNMNSDSSDESDSDNEYTPIINKDQSNIDIIVANNALNSKIDNLISSHSIAKLDIVGIEAKLDRLEKKYAGLYPMLDKILDKIENLNNDVQKMKSNTTSTLPTRTSSVEPTIVSACQNENIKFEIKEEEQIKVVNIDAPVLQTKEESVTVSKADESDDEDDEDDEVVEEETEEDVEEKSVEEANDEDVEEESKEEAEEESEEETKEESEEEDDEVSVETETKEEDTESVEEEEEEKEDNESVEEELEIITIDDVDYCVNNEENGFIWEITEDGEQGEKVGYIKDGEPFFYADEK